jgi:hypothetical protein
VIKTDLTISELARLCDMAPHAITRAFSNGTLKGEIIKPLNVRIPCKDALDFLSKNQNAKQMLFTTGDVAGFCGLSPQIIIRCFDYGIIKGFKIPGSKHRRIPIDSLVEFLNTLYGG